MAALSVQSKQNTMAFSMGAPSPAALQIIVLSTTGGSQEARNFFVLEAGAGFLESVIMSELDPSCFVTLSVCNHYASSNGMPDATSHLRAAYEIPALYANNSSPQAAD